jgi:hypothetical protein
MFQTWTRDFREETTGHDHKWNCHRHGDENNILMMAYTQAVRNRRSSDSQHELDILMGGGTIDVNKNGLSFC